MATQQEALIELYRRGALSDEQSQALEELANRGVIELPQNQQQTEQEMITAQQLAADVGPIDSLLINTGRGLYDIARAFGFVGDESQVEQRALQALEEQRPITSMVGRSVGQSLPFLPAGVAAGAIPSFGGRVAASTLVGSLEGGAIEAGTGGSTEDIISGAGIGGAITGGFEALFPVVSRLGGALVRRVTGSVPEGSLLTPDGMPTESLQRALNESGLSFEDLTEEGIRMIRSQGAQADPNQAVRLAQFERAGVQPSFGDVTQDFAQQATESRLVESTLDAGAQPFRRFRLGQSQQIRSNLENLVDDLGVPSEVGDSVKDALTSRRTLLKENKNTLYKELSEKSQNFDDFPILPQEISQSLPEPGELRDFAQIAPGQATALDNLMREFGLFGEEGMEEILSLGNFERFRKRLNNIANSDNTGQAERIIGPIRRALDGQIDEASRMIEQAGEPAIAEAAKEARRANVALMTEFDEKALTNKLIANASRRSRENAVESSRVYDKLMAKSTPVEQFGKVVNSISGDAQAIGNLQSSMVMELFNSGFSTASNKIDGQIVFNANSFKRKLDSMMPKLQEAFKNSKQALKQIENMGSIAESIQVPAGAKPKGSASVLLDVANRIGLLSITSKIPGGSALTEILRSPLESGAMRKQGKRAMSRPRTSPSLTSRLNAEEQMIRVAPFVAINLGLTETEDQEGQ